MRSIVSTANPLIKAVAALQQASVRRRERKTIVEGANALAMAVAADAHVVTVLTLDGAVPPVPDETELVVVSEAVLRKSAATQHPAGPVAVVSIPDPTPPLRRDSVVLAGLGDPGNLGTIIRTAVAFGVQPLVLPETTDVWSPKVLRAAAGAHWISPPVPVAGLADVRGLDLTIVAMVAEPGDRPESALAGADPVAIVVGNEAHGLDPALVAAADRRLTISMPGGMESLNASVAAAIALYERSRIRS
ncbi:MAG: TrmH family RNA methyltransferase [Acidimicrobiia bacterium]